MTNLQKSSWSTCWLQLLQTHRWFWCLFFCSTIFKNYKGRVEISVQNYTLCLKNVQKADSGHYTAVVSGNKDQVVAEYKVTVLGKFLNDLNVTPQQHPVSKPSHLFIFQIQCLQLIWQWTLCSAAQTVNSLWPAAHRTPSSAAFFCVTTKLAVGREERDQRSHFILLWTSTWSKVSSSVTIATRSAGNTSSRRLNITLSNIQVRLKDTIAIK